MKIKIVPLIICCWLAFSCGPVKGMTELPTKLQGLQRSMQTLRGTLKTTQDLLGNLSENLKKQPLEKEPIKNITTNPTITLFISENHPRGQVRAQVTSDNSLLSVQDYNPEAVSFFKRPELQAKNIKIQIDNDIADNLLFKQLTNVIADPATKDRICEIIVDSVVAPKPFTLDLTHLSNVVQLKNNSKTTDLTLPAELNKLEVYKDFFSKPDNKISALTKMSNLKRLTVHELPAQAEIAIILPMLESMSVSPSIDPSITQQTVTLSTPALKTIIKKEGTNKKIFWKTTSPLTKLETLNDCYLTSQEDINFLHTNMPNLKELTINELPTQQEISIALARLESLTVSPSADPSITHQTITLSTPALKTIIQKETKNKKIRWTSDSPLSRLKNFYHYSIISQEGVEFLQTTCTRLENLTIDTINLPTLNFSCPSSLTNLTLGTLISPINTSVENVMIKGNHPSFNLMINASMPQLQTLSLQTLAIDPQTNLTKLAQSKLTSVSLENVTFWNRQELSAFFNKALPTSLRNLTLTQVQLLNKDTSPSSYNFNRATNLEELILQDLQKIDSNFSIDCTKNTNLKKVTLTNRQDDASPHTFTPEVSFTFKENQTFDRLEINNFTITKKGGSLDPLFTQEKEKCIVDAKTKTQLGIKKTTTKK